MKAILVIDDMPNDCLECPCYRQTKDGGLFEDCKAVLRPLSPAERDEVPEWCPLKPMSEEEIADAIPISFLKDRIAFNFSWGCYGYAKGLQSAIDEWEKQNESNISNRIRR